MFLCTFFDAYFPPSSSHPPSSASFITHFLHRILCLLEMRAPLSTKFYYQKLCLFEGGKASLTSPPPPIRVLRVFSTFPLLLFFLSVFRPDSRGKFSIKLSSSSQSTSSSSGMLNPVGKTATSIGLCLLCFVYVCVFVF